MTGIYKIISPTDKIYIGQSVDIERRWLEHKSSTDSPKLHNSLKKHGFENHTFEILEECETSLLNEKERYYQDFYDVLGPFGLNLILTTTETKSGYMSEEGKQNLRIKATGRVHSQETIEKMRLNSLNMSQETRDKMSKEKESASYNKKRIINTVTEEVFSSITLAANSIGIRMEYLSDMLLDKRKNTTDFKYY